MPPQTPLVGTTTIHPNNEVNVTPTISYSEEAKKYINFRRSRMIAARDTRDAPRQEFDDMPFLKWYDVMKKADDQYVAPRKNKQDTSINLGTVRDKDSSLLEYAMKYDFEAVAQVYDDEDKINEDLAEVSEDMVKKSKMLENYRDTAKLIYRSMIAFGTTMVEDRWVEKWETEKKFGKGATIGGINTTWTEQRVKTYEGCQAKLWDLRKCYFGDIRKFFLNGVNGQPYFFTVEYESYDMTKQMFGDWDRWKYVSTFVQLTPEVSSAMVYSPYWTLRPVTMNYCEIIRYYDPIANEFAITINGVDMLPIMEKKVKENGIEKTLVSGFPLTAISPSGYINFAKYDLEPMHDFVYSKSQPAKMRVLAEVENMYMKLMIGMMKQRAKPTLGNKSGRMFGEEVTDPATVINDIREGDLFPILPNYTGTQSNDFSFYELLKKELDKNSVERSFQGIENNPASQTATKEMNDMNAQSLKVAALFDGIIRGENQLAWLRTYNIAQNWTKPISMEVDKLKGAINAKYRTISMPAEINGGKKATKKVVFTKDTTMSSEDVHQEEVDSLNKTGKETRIAYLHPEQFRDLKLRWYYSHVPVMNGADPLSYMIFSKQINDAMTFFGPESTNVKKLKYKFAAMTGNDFDTWFISEQELQQKQQQAQQQEQEQQGEEGDGQGEPTIGGLAKGVNPTTKMADIMK